MVGAGAVVTRSVPPHAIVIGNPARIQGYVQTPGPAARPAAAGASESGRTELAVRGVHVQRFPEFTDLRGSLTAGEMPDGGLPFAPRRWPRVRRSESRGARRARAPGVRAVPGLHLGAGERRRGRWRASRGGFAQRADARRVYPAARYQSQFRYDADSVLLVFASHPYDAGDYIRECDAFLAEVGRGSAAL